MIQQVQNSCQFHGLPGDDANKHLDKFLHVTQSIKLNGVTDDALHLYLFPHSLTHHATAWFDRLPRNSINTFEQMAKMFLRKYFPPSMVIKLLNEITNFRQRPNESLFEAWEQIAALIAEMVKINKNLMRVLQVKQQVKAVTPSCETFGGPHSFSDCPPIGNNQGRNQFFQGANQGQNQPSAYQATVYQAPVHQPQIPQPQVVTTNEFTNFLKANDAILKNMQTNMTSLTNSNLELKNMFGQFMKMTTASSLGSRTLPGPTIPTTSSSLPPLVERETDVTKDRVHPTNNKNTEDVQPPVVLTDYLILNHEPVTSPIIKPVASPVSAPKPNQRPLIPYPSRLQDQKLCDKANDQREKFFQIFKDLNFNIIFADALILMPKFGPSIKSLLTNKDKLYELARTPLNDLGRSRRKHQSNAIVRVDKLSLLDLSPTCMTLELADHLISCLVRVAKDVFVKVRTFHFPADLVVVDFDADPRTSRYSANYNDITTNRIDIIDMACEEYSQEVLSFSDVIVSGNPTPCYDPIVSTTFLNDDPSLPPPNQENYLPEVHKELKIYEAKSNKSSIDEPTAVELKDLPPHLEYAFLEGDDKFLVIITKDLSVVEKTALITVLKSHKRSFLKIGRALIDVFKGELTLHVGKEAITFNLDQTSRYSANYNDMTAKRIDVIDMACEEYSQEVLGFSDVIVSGNPTPYYGNYLPEVRKELKVCEAKSKKSSIDEPPEVELKDLPPHLEYAFLEGADKLPIIIAKDLSVEEKTALITDQPYAEDSSPNAQSPEYVPESDFEAHPEDDDNEDPKE
nr:reverse transcriptase domain-containing protein [Tanacetum cinerariifolium]